MERDLQFPIVFHYPDVGNTGERGHNPICHLCNECTRNPISISCGHTFCWNCYSEYRASNEEFGDRCPTCINQEEPNEMYKMKKNLENMQEIQKEFQDFLWNWPIWKVRIGDQVEKKISELEQKFVNSFRYINEEDRNEQMQNLRTYLVTEGEKFCRRHNIKLLINGVPALISLGLAAAPAAGAFVFAAPAAAPAVLDVVVSGATGVAQASLAVLRRWI